MAIRVVKPDAEAVDCDGPEGWERFSSGPSVAGYHDGVSRLSRLESELVDRLMRRGRHLGTLLQIEMELREAQTEVAIDFGCVNALHRLVPYDQAIYFCNRRRRLVALSGARRVDRRRDGSRWLEGVGSWLGRVGLPETHFAGPQNIAELKLPRALQAGQDRAGRRVTWLPCPSPDRGTPSEQLVGSLFFLRAEEFSETECKIMERFAVAVGQARVAVFRSQRARLTVLQALRKVMFGVVIGGLVGSAFVKVPTPVSGVSTVRSERETLIAAPQDGVVKRFVVRDAQRVRAGDVLVELDPVDLIAEHRISQRRRERAQAALRRVQHLGFVDRSALAEVLPERLSVQVASAELREADRQRQSAVVRAPVSGVVRVPEMERLAGSPVVRGSALMMLDSAGSHLFEVNIDVGDGVLVKMGDKATFMPAAQPELSISARVVRVSYEPERSDTGVYSIRVRLRPEDAQAAQAFRPGARGSVVIYGQEQRLFFVLFRKPLGFVRRVFGV